MKKIITAFCMVSLIAMAAKVGAQALVTVGQYRISEDIQGIAITGDSAYISTALRIMDIDISNPTAPRWISTYSDGAGQMDIYGCFVYAVGNHNVDIIDFCVPYQPRFAGQFGQYTNPRAIAFGPDRLYSITQGGQLNFKEYDLIDPAHPSLYRQFTLPGGGYSSDIAVRGDVAYVLFDGGGLFAVDISDSAGLNVVGHVLQSLAVQKITLSGDYAYVTDISQGLWIVDISEPSHMTVTGGCSVPGYPYHICIQGDYALVATYNGILEKVNISNPANPYWVPPQYVYGSIPSLAADSNFIYLASGSTFHILRFATTDVADNPETLPGQFILQGNYPNPFNAQTTISYLLPTESDVTFEAFDIAGRKVKILPLGIQPAGEHAFIWDAGELSSGIYFYRIIAGEFAKSRKCLLLK